jgi:phosphomannomutase
MVTTQFIPHATAAEDGTPVLVTTTTPAILKKLQNGSDVRGVALEGVPGEPVTLNEEAAYLIGAAFVDWLADKKGKKPSELSIAVGRDPRLSGPALANAMFAGFGSKDVGRVVDMGIATTPACFMATVTPGVAYDAGIMLTASHLPFNRNGAKFFTSDGGLDKADIKRICEDAAAACQAAPDGHAIPLDGVDDAVESVPFLEDYAAQLRDLIKKGANHPTAYDEPLTGMKIIVDAGNGSGGFFAKSVLEPLGADVYGSQFLDPDGKFPNHSPNPEDAEAMDSAVEATVKAKADLGVIFDTDVDRSAVIDGDGNPINRNKLIALLAAIILDEHPGSTVVTDSVTSDGLAEFIEGKGGKHVRYMRGYKNVINEGVRRDKAGEPCHLMIETSGHGAMKENYCLDDGAYIAVKIIIEAVRRRLSGGKGISDLLSELREPLEEKEVRLKITCDDFKAYGGDVLEQLKEAVGSMKGYTPVDVNYEGYRVNRDEGDGKRGWFLLRQSLHDPVMVLNFESEIPGGVDAMAKDVVAWLKEKDFASLDASAVYAILDK